MKKNKVLLFRLTFLLLVIAILIALDSYPCWLLKQTNINGKNSDQIHQKNTYIYLFGNLCAECMSRSEINTIKHQKDGVFVVPKFFSDIDINNLRETFNINSDIVRGNDYSETILKRAARCARKKIWKRNIVIKKDIKGKILSAKELR